MRDSTPESGTVCCRSTLETATKQTKGSKNYIPSLCLTISFTIQRHHSPPPCPNFIPEFEDCREHYSKCANTHIRPLHIPSTEYETDTHPILPIFKAPLGPTINQWSTEVPHIRAFVRQAMQRRGFDTLKAYAFVKISSLKHWCTWHEPTSENQVLKLYPAS